MVEEGLGGGWGTDALFMKGVRLSVSSFLFVFCFCFPVRLTLFKVFQV